MPTFTLDQLTTPVTRQEVQASIYQVLGTLGVNTTGWKSGAVVRTMIVGVSVVLSAFSRLMADIARSGFLEFSEEDWLTLVARHVYGVERITATFAAGTVTLTNPGGGIFNMEPGDLIVAHDVTGQTYRNVSAFTLGATSTLDVDVVATAAGSASNAAAHDITTLVTSMVGGVTCDNAIGLSALDDESDPTLRLRCSERLGALSPMGPWDAYSYAIRNATRDDGSPIAVTRIRITKDGYGNVNCYVASADGPVTAPDVAIAQTAAEENAQPEAVAAHVISAAAHTVHVTAEVWVYATAGMTDGQIQTAIAARLATFFQSQPVGGNVIGTDPGKIFADALRAAIAAAVAPHTFHLVMTAPAGDVTLAINDVAVPGVVTVTVHQISPPEGYTV